MLLNQNPCEQKNVNSEFTTHKVHEGAPDEEGLETSHKTSQTSIRRNPPKQVSQVLGNVPIHTLKSSNTYPSLHLLLAESQDLISEQRRGAPSIYLRSAPPFVGSLNAMHSAL